MSVSSSRTQRRRAAVRDSDLVMQRVIKSRPSQG